jgi:uncharacterized protein (DUF3820 family)
MIDKNGILTAGKHKGSNIVDCPISYIKWVLESVKMDAKGQKTYIIIMDLCKDILNQPDVKKDVCSFGKYKGLNYRQILNIDKSYAFWLCLNHKNIDLQIDQEHVKTVWDFIRNLDNDDNYKEKAKKHFLNNI